MIIGNGDISSAIIDRPNITFFASGVSNSRCDDEKEFFRETNLLYRQNRNMHLIYFSSLSIYYTVPDYPYVNHKINMEERIIDNFKSYTIVRLGNIDWGRNPNTLLNYLRNNPDAPILPVYRHIVSKDEFQYWLGMIRVGTKDIMNIPGRMVWVPDLVNEIRNGK